MPTARLPFRLLAVLSLPAALVLPVLPAHAPAVHPVAPRVTRLAVPLAGAVGARTPVRTASFSTIGVTWAHQAARVSVDVTVRTRSLAGRWSGWERLGTQTDDAPDSGAADTRRADFRDGTAPLYVGPADGVAVRAVVAGGRPPSDLRVELVDPGVSAADATLGQDLPAGSAAAAVSQPPIVTRAQWGADETLRRCFSGFTRAPRVGFVHHTDTGNGYSAGDVPAIIRGIYAYHVQSNGWCDIGYNYLVDAFGRVFEGRWGGITADVLGAHTGGFNTDSFGTALIGTFSSVTPPAAMLTALERLEAWKLAGAYADPTGQATLVAEPFSGSLHPAGSTTTFNVISGHRDADSTSCPGDAAYSLLPQIRQAARADIGPGLVHPQLSTPSAAAGDPPAHLTAGLLTPVTWTLTVTDSQGRVVETTSGSGTSQLDAAWDLQASGAAAPPGDYNLTLTGTSSSGATAVPYQATFTITPPPGRFVPVDPVRVLDTRPGPGNTGAPAAQLGPGGTLDLTVAGGSSTVPATATAVLLNVTAVAPTADTDVRAYPTPAAAGTPPNASNLNVPKGATAANLVAVKVGDSGRIRLRNAAGQVDLVADLSGYYLPGSTVGSAYTPVQPVRILDTRPWSENTGAPPAPVGPGGTLDLTVAGSNGVPANATAVALNVTAVDPGGPTDVRVYPTPPAGGTGYPVVSNLNTTAGVTVPNLVVVKVGDGGRVRIRNQSSSLDLLADLAGYYAPASTAQFVPLTPVRLLDTRPSDEEIGAPAGPLGAGATIDLRVAGVAGIPAAATAVVLNVTAAAPSGSSDVRVYPTPASGSAYPNVSNLNVRAGVTVPNLVVVPVGAGGQVRLRNSGAALYLLADTAGYYLG